MVSMRIMVLFVSKIMESDHKLFGIVNLSD